MITILLIISFALVFGYSYWKLLEALVTSRVHVNAIKAYEKSYMMGMCNE